MNQRDQIIGQALNLLTQARDLPVPSTDPASDAVVADNTVKIAAAIDALNAVASGDVATITFLVEVESPRRIGEFTSHVGTVKASNRDQAECEVKSLYQPVDGLIRWHDNFRWYNTRYRLTEMAD